MKHILHSILESRRLEVRCGLKTKEQTRKVYVHMLNGTLCATERTLCCLVENYQTAEVKPSGCAYPYSAELSTGCCDTRSPSSLHARKGLSPIRKGIAQGPSKEASVI
jgi:hypothetical protein